MYWQQSWGSVRENHDATATFATDCRSLVLASFGSSSVQCNYNRMNEQLSNHDHCPVHLSQIPKTWRDVNPGTRFTTVGRQMLRLTCRFSSSVLLDTTPMPADIPTVQEIGATSAPLLSASYFIGARCRPYNDDFMQCKAESYGKGEIDCLKEGRKVTRCATSV